MLKLYYVDDERSMKKFIISYIQTLNKNENIIDFHNENIYCGAGSTDKFYEKISSEENRLDNCMFLLDVRMPVPKALNTNERIWGNYRGARSDVCGFALAKYLIQKKLIDKKK